MPDRPEPAPEPPSRLEDIHRSEQTMVQVRWAAVVFATVQVLAYDDVPYPPGFRAVALLLVAALGTANVAIWLLSRRVRTLSGARLLSVGAMTVDVLVASGFVWRTRSTSCPRCGPSCSSCRWRGPSGSAWPGRWRRGPRPPPCTRSASCGARASTTTRSCGTACRSGWVSAS